MKKALMIFGGIFVVLFIAGAIVFSVIAVKGKALDRESKEYVDRVTPIILADLTKETLFKYASDELKNSASPEEFEKIFNWFTKLGQFREYKGSSGQSRIFISPGKGKQVTGLYEARAEFEKGPAIIKMTAIKKGDMWQVMGFNINSMALANE